MFPRSFFHFPMSTYTHFIGNSSESSCSSARKKVFVKEEAHRLVFIWCDGIGIHLKFVSHSNAAQPFLLYSARWCSTKIVQPTSWESWNIICAHTQISGCAWAWAIPRVTINRLGRGIYTLDLFLFLKLVLYRYLPFRVQKQGCAFLRNYTLVKVQQDDADDDVFFAMSCNSWTLASLLHLYVSIPSVSECGMQTIPRLCIVLI